MNDIQIKCFLAAAASQSFTEAAEKLYMTPPTFGRHISSLERELGYPLFLRGWKKLRLTAAGELMHKGFEEMIEKFQFLQTEAERLNSGQTGQLTIGILEGQLLDDRLRTVVRYFREAYPELILKLERYSFRAMEEALLCGSLDLGITPTVEVEQTDDLARKPFCTLPNYIVLPRDHPLARREDLTLADFAQESFLELASGECRMVSRLMQECCRRAGFEPKRVVCPDLNTQLFALEAGLGIMALNQNHMACNNPALVAKAVPGLPVGEFCAAWHRANINPAVPLFLARL